MIDKKSTMANRINKTSICSILFLDMIDYSKKSDEDQIEIKNHFNDLISLSLGSVAKDDRIILDTGDGVAIAYMGSPEDLMFVALTIRDGVLKGNIHSQNLLFVRFGINLGPVRIVSDINGRPNIIGDGINVAQRVMSFSEPNQILVSRSFYEITSRLTVEFSEMFAYSGVKQDKHVRDHELYSVRSHSNQDVSIGEPDAPKDERRSSDKVEANNRFSWMFAISSLLIIAAVFLTIKVNSSPSEQSINLINSANTMPTNIPAKIPLPDKLIKDDLMLNKAQKKSSLDDLKSASQNKLTTKSKLTLVERSVKSKQDAIVQESVIQDKLAKKAAKKVTPIKANQEAGQQAVSRVTRASQTTNTENPNNKNVEIRPVDHPDKLVNGASEKANEKSFFKPFIDSVKQGQERKCDQGQIALGQCN